MTYSNNPARQKRLSGLALALLATGNIITHSPAWQATAGLLDQGLDRGHHHTHDGDKSSDKNNGKDHPKHDPQHEGSEKRFRTDNWRKRRHRKEFKPI